MQEFRDSGEGRPAEPARTSEGKAAEVERLVAPMAADLGFEIVRVQLSGDSGRRILQIMAERPDGGMSIDDCAELSRSVSAVLDVEDPIEGRYDLEVSSPGMDRPLTRLKDFRNWAGFEARIELSAPQDGRKRFRGLLAGVEEHRVLIREADEGETDRGEGEAERLYRIPFEAIARAKLVLTDALIAATAGRAEQPESEN